MRRSLLRLIGFGRNKILLVDEFFCEAAICGRLARVGARIDENGRPVDRGGQRVDFHEREKMRHQLKLEDARRAAKFAFRHTRRRFGFRLLRLLTLCGRRVARRRHHAEIAGAQRLCGACVAQKLRRSALNERVETIVGDIRPIFECFERIGSADNIQILKKNRFFVVTLRFIAAIFARKNTTHRIFHL